MVGCLASCPPTPVYLMLLSLSPFKVSESEKPTQAQLFKVMSQAWLLTGCLL